MQEHLHTKILTHLKSGQYRPARPRKLARELNLAQEHDYGAFRDALKELMHEGRVMLGAGGNVVLPSSKQSNDVFTGTYRQNKRGFGFVIPTDPEGHEDLFIPEGENGGAITGDVVRAKITNREQRDGKIMYRGRVIEIVSRSQKRFVGTLAKQHNQWLVLPDGNTLTAPILAPDAASRHVPPGTKVVIELTRYPEGDERAQGVITEILGKAGEKDVDLKSVIVQFNLPGEFPEESLAQARRAVDDFNASPSLENRLDLRDEIICTIDPDDAKDYDDAISLRRLDSGLWELGVHIADVSHFIPAGSPLDVEAQARGNSSYFPGFVIPMLPEILSNGVCSLQEGVPRLCKSAFITFDEDSHPISARFANVIIHSACRLRYREAQAIIDNAEVIPHPDGPRPIGSYDPAVVELLHQMNSLARRIQKRRLAAGQLVLELPEVELVLDENGKVIGAESEDSSFTHTLIEMFMVEANEAVARLLDSLDVPFLRRIHPDPEPADGERLRHFVEVAGYRLPKEMDRKSLQHLLTAVKGKPESFAINLAVLKSLTRAEYSPQPVGHYALASKHYCHFTSPIRRYADLTIHRLLDAYLAAQQRQGGQGKHGGKKPRKLELDDVPSYANLVELGRRLSFTERRSEDAERELRKVKLLELLEKHIGEDFSGVVTGITNFGLFVQLSAYLIEGLIRYEDLMDDWWDVDERAGRIRGQRTGTKIGIGDLVTARVVRVDPARRELDLAIIELVGRPGRLGGGATPNRQKTKPADKPKRRHPFARRRSKR
ncbi:MAG TPA: ribonuclease R [Tepidisphaeraceae bacterium]|nr:ribonuclease R [Tepidisphaeraceae bacterium]